MHLMKHFQTSRIKSSGGVIFGGSIIASHLQKRGRVTEAGVKSRKLSEVSQAAPRSRLRSDLSFCSSVRARHGFSSHRAETAESPLRMDHLLPAVIFPVQLWPCVFPDRLFSGHITMANPSLIRNIIEIYGVINRDLCDVNPLYAPVVDVLVKMIKRCLGTLLNRDAAALVKCDITVKFTKTSSQSPKTSIFWWEEILITYFCLSSEGKRNKWIICHHIWRYNQRCSAYHGAKVGLGSASSAASIHKREITGEHEPVP